MVTFAIFFLVPRLAGRLAGEPGVPLRRPDRDRGDRSRRRPSGWASTTRFPCSTARWVKAIVVGADYDYGPGVEHCPAPCLGYSFITHQPVWPDLLDRLPVTISLAVGAAVIWLISGWPSVCCPR